MFALKAGLLSFCALIVTSGCMAAGDQFPPAAPAVTSIVDHPQGSPCLLCDVKLHVDKSSQARLHHHLGWRLDVGLEGGQELGAHIAGVHAHVGGEGHRHHARRHRRAAPQHHHLEENRSAATFWEHLGNTMDFSEH